MWRTLPACVLCVASWKHTPLIYRTIIRRTIIRKRIVSVMTESSRDQLSFEQFNFEQFNFEQAQAYRNGSWVQFKDLSWSVTDVATTQGVMLVERLRTAGGQLIDSQLHVDRLLTSASLVGLKCDDLCASITSLLDDLVLRNRSFIRVHGDVGVVVLLSPGDPGLHKSKDLVPTSMIHLTPIPFAQLANWYEHGCRLHVSETRNVPPEAWSPWIKTRSRLQYYLADNPVGAPTAIGRSTQKADSVAVLLTIEGFATETSISNLILVDLSGRLRSPSKRNILQGVSLAKVQELASKMGVEMDYCDLTADDFRQASEILLTGTTGFVWAGIEFEGVRIGNGRPGTFCKSLQQMWIENLGFDFLSQASNRSGRGASHPV